MTALELITSCKAVVAAGHPLSEAALEQLRLLMVEGERCPRCQAVPPSIEEYTPHAPDCVRNTEVKR